MSSPSVGDHTEPTPKLVIIWSIVKSDLVMASHYTEAQSPGTVAKSRFVGLKSRGCYDTPGLTILRQAHIDLEGMVLDSKVRSISDRLTQDWLAAIYNGMYFSPERELVEHTIKFSQRQVEGTVSLVAYKGCAYVVERSSETSNFYSADESSMDTLDINWTPQDTTGFIVIQAVRFEKYGARKIKDGQPLIR